LILSLGHNAPDDLDHRDLVDIAEALLMRPLHAHPDAAEEFQRALRAPLPGTREAKAEAERANLAQMGLTPEMVRQMMAKRDGDPPT
jgi:hypothetical protein